MSDATPTRYVFIKAKPPEAKRFSFLGSKGALTHLRVHAARIERAKADGMLAELREQNPQWRFVTVSA